MTTSSGPEGAIVAWGQPASSCSEQHPEVQEVELVLFGIMHFCPQTITRSWSCVSRGIHCCPSCCAVCSGELG